MKLTKNFTFRPIKVRFSYGGSQIWKKNSTISEQTFVKAAFVFLYFASLVNMDVRQKKTRKCITSDVYNMRRALRKSDLRSNMKF